MPLLSRLPASPGLTAAALGLAMLTGASAAPARPPEISVARADALIARLPAGDPWVKTPDGSTLAWGESHLLHALVDLYEATDNAKYLEEVARRGERLLRHRDDRRGAVDGSGRSQPAWSMASKYVVAAATLHDGAGRPCLAVRSTPSAYNNSTELEVVPGAAGRFTLLVRNSHFKREERFDGLSLDPTDARFAEKVVNHPRPSHSARAGKFEREPSSLIRVGRREGGGVPGAVRLTLRPIPLAYMGYLGVIYHPLLRCAELVRAETRLAGLRPSADEFVQAAEESYADASRRLWREGPGTDEGYYLCCERGESFPFDNVPEPFNYLGRHTAAQLALHRLTGRPEYRERAVRMARLFRNRLKHDAERDLYTWNYWYEPVTSTGWTPANSPSLNLINYPPVAAVEDISHGVLDLALVLSAHAAGEVFDDRDVRRLANTLLVHVLNPARTGVRRRVDGTGGEYPDYFPALAGWLELAGATPAVYLEIRRTVANGGPENLQLIAALLKWERLTLSPGRAR